MDKFKNIVSITGPRTTATSAKEGRMKAEVSSEAKKQRKGILKSKVRRAF